MNVLVLNCGSSSIKFQLFRMPEEALLIQGKAERNETGGTGLWFKTESIESASSWEGFSFAYNFEKILAELVRPSNGCLVSSEEVDVVGHRLIHGGEMDTAGGAVKITEKLISHMKTCVPLAPLHYPPNLEGIHTISRLMPGVLQAGVFDTAFHYSLPPRAFLYGIPLEWYRKHQIRRYGFHGTSHKYVAQRACELAGLHFSRSRIISCHLGNGASVAAIKNGKSIDTSMGMTPVEGLLMGTRSGDIDAGVLIYLQQHFNLSADVIQQLINKQGGLLGLSGISADYRAVEEAAQKGNEAALNALDAYHYRVKKYIGSYCMALGGLDALVFTGGIGENSSRARKEICSETDFLGIRFSEMLNDKMNGTESVISETGSKVKVLIVPAREELMIAREVAKLV
jgi:acetate kinase